MRYCPLLRLFLILNLRMRHIHMLPLLRTMYFLLSFLLCLLCLRGRYIRSICCYLLYPLSLLFLLRLLVYTSLFLLFHTRLLRFRCSRFVLCLLRLLSFLFSFLFHRMCNKMYSRASNYLP